MTFDKTSVLKELQKIPGIGKSLSEDLYMLGMRKVSDLKSGNPEKLYNELNSLTGKIQDRCVLYGCRCAVYFATEQYHDRELRKWWNWKDKGTPAN